MDAQLLGLAAGCAAIVGTVGVMAAIVPVAISDLRRSYRYHTTRYTFGRKGTRGYYRKHRASMTERVWQMMGGK